MKKIKLISMIVAVGVCFQVLCGCSSETPGELSQESQKLDALNTADQLLDAWEQMPPDKVQAVAANKKEFLKAQAEADPEIKARIERLGIQLN